MGAKGVIFLVGNNNPCFKRSQESVANKERVVHNISVGRRIEVSASISGNPPAEHAKSPVLAVLMLNIVSLVPSNNSL